MTTEAAPSEVECKFAKLLLNMYFNELAEIRKNSSYTPMILPVHWRSEEATDAMMFNTLCEPTVMLGGIGYYLDRSVFDEESGVRKLFLTSCMLRVVKKFMPTTAEGVVQVLDDAAREQCGMTVDG